MDSRRYLFYRDALELIDELDGALGAGEAERLRDLTEGLLLSREDRGEGDEAAALLLELTGVGALETPQAAQLWRAMSSAGPAPAERTPRTPFGDRRELGRIA